MAPRRTHRQKLLEAAAQGGLTLVLGAGVSLPQRLPGWTQLVDMLWQQVFPGDPLPEAEARLPHHLPMLLELVAREVGAHRFTTLLREALYAQVVRPTAAALRHHDATLAVVARALVAERQAGAARRVVRVITFNSDDMLEQATQALSPRQLVLKPVVRASQHPERGTGQQPIPCYHLHGYLPQRPEARWHEAAPDTLVFTDAQYWANVAEPLSFANRVMAFALHDSRCVFLGLSMTDLNILRWLALRSAELEADKASQFAQDAASPERVARAVRRVLCRHFWVRAPGDDPGGLLTRFLAVRGVLSVDVEGGWEGPGLRRLLEEALPPQRPAARARPSAG